MQVESESTNPKFDRFISVKALRSEATADQYSYSIPRALGTSDIDHYLTLLKEEMENVLIDYAMKEAKRGVSGAVIMLNFTAVKSFVSFQLGDNYLNWSKIKGCIPKVNHVADDRPPTIEEIRKLLSVCDLRMRAVVLIMASSGVRAGAFSDLKMKHLQRYKIENTEIGSLRIYASSTEKYTTFISPEALEALDAYLDSRKRAGEKLSPESPLIRDDYAKYYDWSKAGKLRPAKHVSAQNLSICMIRAWRLAGVRRIEGAPAEYKRHEFQAAHGLRKFFRSSARGLSPDDLEYLLGHKSSYYKPDLERIKAEYVKILPSITITEVQALKLKNQELGENQIELVRSMSKLSASDQEERNLIDGLIDRNEGLPLEKLSDKISQGLENFRSSRRKHGENIEELVEMKVREMLRRIEDEKRKTGI